MHVEIKRKNPGHCVALCCKFTNSVCAVLVERHSEKNNVLQKLNPGVLG